MIALNELIQNRELFEKRYNLKGRKIHLKKIFDLESKRKDLQLKTEAMRADCNKICGSVADIRNKNQEASNIICKITKLDNQIAKNNKRLAMQNKQINKKLARLHNLPDNENVINLQLDISPRASTISELENFLGRVSQIETTTNSIKAHLKELQNIIADNLPKIIKCKNNYLILCAQNEFENLKKQILDYFKSHSEHLIKVSIKKLQKECAETYLVHLNKTVSLYVDIIREFNTRFYKIKYHDSLCDMTKFVNQINIRIK